MADDLDMEPDRPELPVASVADQFPAVGGDVAGEVARRTADGSDGDQFVKIFVVARGGISNSDSIHQANAVGVLQEAIQRGLHPKGDVYLIGCVEKAAKHSVSTEITYAVDVVPASIDDHPETTVDPKAIREAQADEEKPKSRRAPRRSSTKRDSE